MKNISIDLTRPIEVDFGVNAQKSDFHDAVVVEVRLDQTNEHRDGSLVWGLTFVVKCDDESIRVIEDAFGWNKDVWRYKSDVKSCDECEFQVCEGGDCVPFGSDVAYLPTVKYCDCPLVPEGDIDEICEKTNFGVSCKFFNWRKKDA